MWCCAEFESRFRGPRDEGLSIDLRADGPGPWFCAGRAAEARPGDRIAFCPWCAKDLLAHYAEYVFELQGVPLAPPARRSARLPLLAVALGAFVLVGLAALVAFAWVARSRSSITRGEPVLRTTVEHYLEMKKNGYIREVWIRGHMLTARLEGGMTQGNRAYRFIEVELPNAFVEDHGGFRQLSEGIDPQRFHYER